MIALPVKGASPQIGHTGSPSSSRPLVRERQAHVERPPPVARLDRDALHQPPCPELMDERGAANHAEKPQQFCITQPQLGGAGSQSASEPAAVAAVTRGGAQRLLAPARLGHEAPDSVAGRRPTSCHRRGTAARRRAVLPPRVIGGPAFPAHPFMREDQRIEHSSSGVIAQRFESSIEPQYAASRLSLRQREALGHGTLSAHRRSHLPRQTVSEVLAAAQRARWRSRWRPRRRASAPGCAQERLRASEAAAWETRAAMVVVPRAAARTPSAALRMKCTGSSPSSTIRVSSPRLALRAHTAPRIDTGRNPLLRAEVVSFLQAALLPAGGKRTAASAALPDHPALRRHDDEEERRVIETSRTVGAARLCCHSSSRPDRAASYACRRQRAQCSSSGAQEEAEAAHRGLGAPLLAAYRHTKLGWCHARVARSRRAHDIVGRVDGVPLPRIHDHAGGVAHHATSAGS